MKREPKQVPGFQSRSKGHMVTRCLRFVASSISVCTLHFEAVIKFHWKRHLGCVGCLLLLSKAKRALFLQTNSAPRFPDHMVHAMYALALAFHPTVRELERCHKSS